MKILELVAFMVLLMVSFEANEQQKPNIILFLVDDMGWQDTSFLLGYDIGEQQYLSSVYPKK